MIVPARTLKSVLDEFNYDKISLVVDIEGAELELIENELDVIAEHVETLIIELHAQNWGAGVDGVEKIKNDLIESGFVISQQVGSDFVLENKRYKDINGKIWSKMGYPPKKV